MTKYCAECGAVLAEGSTCQTLLDEFLNLEYINPAYRQTHFLTIACFMIQHRRYSNSALKLMRSKLQVALDEQSSDQQLHQIAATDAADATQTMKYTRQVDEQPLPRITWSTTIADVAKSLQEPQKYYEQVKQWAQVTLKEMDAWFQENSLHSQGILTWASQWLSKYILTPVRHWFTKLSVIQWLIATPFFKWLNKKSSKPLERSYLFLRIGIGIIGVALPIVLIVGTIILERNLQISGSISSYYYRVLGRVFVGSLWAIGIFLICYQYEPLDDIVSTLAGVCAIGVSLFPTTPDCPSNNANCLTSQQIIIGNIHTGFASVFFGILAIMVLFLFTRKNKIPKEVTKRKKQRNTVYYICGGIMLLCILSLLFILTIPGLQQLQSHHWILAFEAAADFAFGAAWFIKGETFILKDKDLKKGMAVESVQNDSTRVVASTVGILAGLLGVVHGCLEVVQVNPTGGMFINAMGLPCQASMTWHLCFPAVTIIPNFFITGLLAIIVSVFIIIWAAVFVESRYGGLVLIGSSIILLLVGGGYISFILCLIAGLVATRTQDSFTWWTTNPTFRWQSYLAKLWPWSWIFPVIPVAVYIIPGFRVNEFMPIWFILTIVITLGLLLLTIFSAFAYDIQQRQDSTQQAPSVAVEFPPI